MFVTGRYLRALCRLACGLAVCMGLGSSPAVSAGWLDRLAVAETHRLEPGDFYHDLRRAEPVGERATGVLPAALDRELVASFEYSDRIAKFGPVLAAVQQRLAAAPGLQPVAGASLPTRGAPRVYVGSAIGDLAPPDAEEAASPGDRFPPMVLHLERPAKAWREAAAQLMAEQGLEYLVVVNLAVSQYPKGRRGVFAKNVLLGTGHERPVKFLTAEDRLLQVLQVAGVIVNAEGQVVRAGAEGILARDTPFLAQAFELEKMLDDDGVEAALSTERRDDLAGAPLSLEVAIHNLVGQLLLDPRRVLRPL
jgi:hypothetical protein